MTKQDSRAAHGAMVPGQITRSLQQMDDSWLDSIPNGDLIRRIGLHGRATPWLALYLAQQFGFRMEESVDSDELLPFEWLDAADLRELVVCAGCCVAAARLRSVVDGAKVRALVEALGERYYTFALRQGGTLTVGADPGDLQTCPVSELPDHLPRAGLGVLVAAADGLGRQRLHQLLLKLPLSWAKRSIFLHRPLAMEPAKTLLSCIVEKGILYDGYSRQA